MKRESKDQRQKRVIARGEHSNHSHVITGDVGLLNLNKEYEKPLIET